MWNKTSIQVLVTQSDEIPQDEIYQGRTKKHITYSLHIG